MISNLHPHTFYAVHLRASSVSGGKDWVGSVTMKGQIHTYWGRTGNIVWHAARPGDITILHKLIIQKLNGKNKYRQVDEYYAADGWLSQRRNVTEPPGAKPSASQPSEEPFADWVEAPDAAIKWDF